ncbi:THAP domain-containing protein 1-like [Temnothorax curvispinosus]|uniref:THAP domain-containing protein 1-like n=1 Tax=Temnothorax curvispinosus TaxID=300111 RepID=A0A6J1PL70_9HYME|nr:THAP domain-containing protein 1-like [Temnothorax curvispinosus]
MAKISKYSYICSLHFTENCIEKTGFSCRLKSNSVPTIFPNAPKENTADLENTEPSNMPSVIFESISQREEEIYETPSKKRMCYAGDIKTAEMKNMSPRTLIKAMEILKRSCNKKDKIINRLKVQQYRQKKRIDSLQTLLCELRTKGLLSATSSDIVQVLKSLLSFLGIYMAPLSCRA